MNEKETTKRSATRTGLGPCGRALQRHLGLRKDKEIGPGLQHGTEQGQGRGQGKGLGRGMGRGLGLGRGKKQGLARNR